MMKHFIHRFFSVLKRHAFCLFLIIIALLIGYFFCDQSKKTTIVGPIRPPVEIFPLFKKILDSESTDAEIIKIAIDLLEKEKPNWRKEYCFENIKFIPEDDRWLLFFNHRGYYFAKFGENGCIKIERAIPFDSYFILSIHDETHVVLDAWGGIGSEFGNYGR